MLWLAPPFSGSGQLPFFFSTLFAITGVHGLSIVLPSVTFWLRSGAQKSEIGPGEGGTLGSVRTVTLGSPRLASKVMSTLPVDVVRWAPGSKNRKFSVI